MPPKRKLVTSKVEPTKSAAKAAKAAPRFLDDEQPPKSLSSATDGPTDGDANPFISDVDDDNQNENASIASDDMYDPLADDDSSAPAATAQQKSSNNHSKESKEANLGTQIKELCTAISDKALGSDTISFLSSLELLEEKVLAFKRSPEGQALLEKRIAEEAEARKKAAAEEEARKKAAVEEEARKKAAMEEEARKKAAAEEDARKKAVGEEEARKKAAAEEEARKKAAVEEEARKKAAVEEEARKKAAVEEEARKKAAMEEEARKKAAAEEDARKKAAAEEEEARKKAAMEEEARKKAAAEEDARKKAVGEEEARNKAAAEEEARRKAVAEEEACKENAETENNRKKKPRDTSKRSRSEESPDDHQQQDEAAALGAPPPVSISGSTSQLLSPVSNGNVTEVPMAASPVPAADTEVQIFWDAENISGRPYAQPAVLLMSILDQMVNDGIISSNASHCTQVYFVDREKSRYALADHDKSQLRDAQCTLIQCTKRKEDADRQIAAAIRRQIDNKHNPTSRPIVIVSSDKDFNSILQDAKRAGLPTYIVHEAKQDSMHENLLGLYAKAFNAKELVRAYSRQKPASSPVAEGTGIADKKRRIGHAESSQNEGNKPKNDASRKPSEEPPRRKSRQELPPKQKQPEEEVVVPVQPEREPTELSVPDVVVNKVSRPVKYLVDNEGLRRVAERGLSGTWCDSTSASHDIARCTKIHTRQVRVGEARTPVSWWTLDPTTTGYITATDPKNSRVRNFWWCPNQGTDACSLGEKCTHLHERYINLYIPPKENRHGEHISAPISFFNWNLALQNAMEQRGGKDPVVCVAYLRGQPHDADTCRALHPKLIKLSGMRRRYATEFVPNPGAQLAVHGGAVLSECECRNSMTCKSLHLRPLTERTVAPVVRPERGIGIVGDPLYTPYAQDVAKPSSGRKVYTPTDSEIEWAKTFIGFYKLDLKAIFTVEGYPRLRKVHEDLENDSTNQTFLTKATGFLRGVEKFAKEFGVPVEPYYQQ